MLGLALVSSGAQAQAIIKVSPDRNTVTATSDRGTATTHIVRDGNGGATFTTRYQPAKPSYQPLDGNSYQPMGSSYRPTGR